MLKLALIIGPWGAIGAGFLAGFFFNNTVIFILTGIIAITIVLIAIDMAAKEIEGLLNLAAIFVLMLVLVAMWITAISVNHWWTNIIPTQLLR